MTVWHVCGTRGASPAAATLNSFSPGDLTWAFVSAPSRIRTCGLLLRRQPLYPLSYRGQARPKPTCARGGVKARQARGEFTAHAMVVVGVPNNPMRIYVATFDELVVSPDVGSRQHLLARRQARPATRPGMCADPA